MYIVIPRLRLAYNERHIFWLQNPMIDGASFCSIHGARADCIMRSDCCARVRGHALHAWKHVECMQQQSVDTFEQNIWETLTIGRIDVFVQSEILLYLVFL